MTCSILREYCQSFICSLMKAIFDYSLKSKRNRKKNYFSVLYDRMWQLMPAASASSNSFSHTCGSRKTTQ